MNRRTESSPSRWPLALALLSAGVTAAQVALMQLLSCIQWHHFAYLVVSVALLGYGASGTVLSLWREPLLARHDTLTPWLLIAAGVTFASVPLLLQHEVLRFDLYLLFVDAGQWLRLAIACVLLALPFFCAGLASGLITVSTVEQAGRMYAANLAGAGAGALGALGLLELAAPPQLPALTALLPLVGAMVLGQRGPLVYRRRRQEAERAPEASGPPRDLGSYKWRQAFALGCGALALVLAWHADAPALSPFKDLARTLDLPDARIRHSEPSAQGWLQIVEAPALRGAPPTSLAFTGVVPRQRAVFLDGNRYGSILRGDPDAGDELAIFDASPESLPWRRGTPRRVLLLHEGAGGEAAFAARRGATTIDLIEPHRRFAAQLREHFAGRAAIRVRTQETRIALARAAQADDGSHYDLIRFPTVGTFGGSAGLRAVGEEFLLTREALATAWQALAPDGMLIVTAWMDHPERTVLRLLATLIAGLEDAGAGEPGNHLVAVRGWSSVTFLVFRRALDDTGLATIRTFCRDIGFDPLLLPGLQPGEREEHHAWDNPEFFTRVDAIATRARGAADRGLPDPLFRLDPPSDDRPYFSQFLRWGALRTLADSQGLQGVPFFELGSIVVAITAMLLFLLATVLIVLPLVRTGWQRGRRGWTFFYFAALGAGFMLVEIGLMLRLTPIAGGAVPAAAIVLATLLIGAGLGSRWSQRWSANRATLIRITVGIAAGVTWLGVMTSILPIGWDAGRPVRLAACALIILPAALVLGMAFPTGLRHLASDAPTHVPWAWAINNCLSVVTPALTTLAALQWGLVAVFGCAVAVYVIAASATFIALARVPH